MEFPVFVGLAVVVIWLLDQVINYLVELLLKFSQVIRAVSVILIISFLLGVYYAPEQVALVFGWFIQGIGEVFGLLSDGFAELTSWLSGPEQQTGPTMAPMP